MRFPNRLLSDYDLDCKPPSFELTLFESNPLTNESNSQTPHQWLADLALLVTVFLWGINIPIMKYALQHVDKYAFNALRLTLSTVALGIIVWWLRAPIVDRREGATPIGKQWTRIILFAVLTGFGYQLLFLIGVDSTSAGNTALILSAIPMWTAILSFFFLRERLPAVAWIGLMIAISGVMIVTLSKTSSADSNSTLFGNLLISGAAVSWAIASVLSMPMMRNISPVALTFYSIAITLPLHFWMTGGALNLDVLRDNPRVLLALVYSGVFSTGIASALWNFGLKQMGPSHAAGFQNLVPIIALATSWVLLGEIPFTLQIAGGLLIIVGLVVMRSRRKANSLQAPQTAAVASEKSK